MDNLKNFIKEDTPIKQWKDILVRDWIILKDGRVCQVVNTDFVVVKAVYPELTDTNWFISTIHPPTMEKIFVKEEDMFGFYVKSTNKKL